MRGVHTLLAVALSLTSCGSGERSRKATVVSALASADEALIRARPKLCARKYERMASTPFLFFRGNLPLYARDWEAGEVGRSVADEVLVPSAGDAHPENFGTLLSADGFRLEHNDLDAAERWPSTWDLRRLTAGVVLFARTSPSDDPTLPGRAADAARAVVEAYADGVAAHAAGAARVPISSGMGGGPLVEDLFAKSEDDRATSSALADLSLVESGVRRLRRGGVEADDPLHQLRDLPPAVVAAIPAAVDRWAQSVPSAPAREARTVLDVAREVGSGVSSLPRVRILVLLRGASDAPDDDWILELKELSDPPLLPRARPQPAADDAGARVMVLGRTLWSTTDADPSWGVTTLVGLPLQGKPRTTGARSVRLSRLAGKSGTPDALVGLARVLGGVLARSHAASSELRDVASAIAIDRDRFVQGETDTALSLAARVQEDHALFRAALDELGPRLGVPVGDDDAPTDLAAALFDGP